MQYVYLQRRTPAHPRLPRENSSQQQQQQPQQPERHRSNCATTQHSRHPSPGRLHYAVRRRRRRRTEDLDRDFTHQSSSAGEEIADVDVDEVRPSEVRPVRIRGQDGLAGGAASSSRTPAWSNYS